MIRFFSYDNSVSSFLFKMSLIEGFADTSKYEKKNTSLDKL